VGSSCIAIFICYCRKKYFIFIFLKLSCRQRICFSTKPQIVPTFPYPFNYRSRTAGEEEEGWWQRSFWPEAAKQLEVVISGVQIFDTGRISKQQRLVVVSSPWGIYFHFHVQNIPLYASTIKINK